jgi:hypothetical protein
MVLQKIPTRFAKNNPTKFLLGQNFFWHYNGNKRDFSKNRDRKYHNAVHNNTKPNNPNTSDITDWHWIISTTFLN